MDCSKFAVGDRVKVTEPLLIIPEYGFRGGEEGTVTRVGGEGLVIYVKFDCLAGRPVPIAPEGLALVQTSRQDMTDSTEKEIMECFGRALLGDSSRPFLVVFAKEVAARLRAKGISEQEIEDIFKE